MPTNCIRPLVPDDLPFAQNVREIAGWNQTDADWMRLIQYQPDGCFVVEHDGKPAGTATTTVFNEEVGWIGMVLVHPDFRRRGLATLLLESCIEYLTPITKCIKLDATPAGMKVYEKLGFVEESRLHRWEGKAPLGVSEKSNGAAIPVEMDTDAFGTNRGAYLNVLAKDSSVLVSANGSGYGMIRQGKNASYLGPVISADKSAGAGMVSSLLSIEAGKKTYWDIHETNRAAVEAAEELGFVRQRELIRMYLGTENFQGRLDLQWAISGPETG